MTGFGVEQAGQGMTGVVSVIASSARVMRERGLVTAVSHQMSTDVPTAPPTNSGG